MKAEPEDALDPGSPSSAHPENFDGSHHRSPSLLVAAVVGANSRGSGDPVAFAAERDKHAEISRTCLLHECGRARAISTSRQMEGQTHLSEADNAECLVGVRPDNWFRTPIVGPAGACCMRARAICGLSTV